MGLSLPPPTRPALFEEARVETGMEWSTFADVRDRAAVDAAFARARPEIVFHLAAQPIVLRSYTEPVETFAANVMGTAHVLDALRRCDGARAAVIVTSDKCYENREWVWGYRETDAMGGYDPYSASKGCAEIVAAAFRSSYFNPRDYEKHGLAVATVRAGNVVGGGDWAEDRLIPDLVRGLIAGAPVSIRNPPRDPAVATCVGAAVGVFASRPRSGRGGTRLRRGVELRAARTERASGRLHRRYRHRVVGGWDRRRLGDRSTFPAA